METEIEDNGQPKTRLIEYAGKAQTVEAWAREIGLSAPVIRYRIRNGWPIEQALSTPVWGRSRRPK